MRQTMLCLVFPVALVTSQSLAIAQDRSLDANPELTTYFGDQVADLERRNELTQYESAALWQQDVPRLRAELFDMLGLMPMPERAPLEAETTATTEEAEFVVERVHFQSLPGLYVTGNFYRPKSVDKPLPTILYLCGHGAVRKDGVSFGNKVYYQHHGAWFARNGYCCLAIDSLQLGEIEGIHHGTYREGRWWWNSRGYTPAGVEAWNCIRALDYLESRPEVDATRMGATGRSGGGAYSWWIAALDERIACAVPVAGITSLRDHVVNGCVEGHCDCMYFVNTHRWDYAKVAALVAPRPLLISNTDKDPIFPLEGVYDIHRQVRHVYRLLNAGDKLGLQITEGPHEDTQELHIHAFRWFNRFLKQDDSLIETTAVPYFEPEQLQVFSTLPSDQINTQIDESFVPAAEALSEEDILRGGRELCDAKIAALRERCFRAWPTDDENSADDLRIQVEPSDVSASRDESLLQFESERFVPLVVHLDLPNGSRLERLESLTVTIASSPEATTAVSAVSEESELPRAIFIPRPGTTPWNADEKKFIQIQRRYMLIGTTLDAQRVLDIRRMLQVVRQQCPNLMALHLKADAGMDSLVLLASLFEPPVTSIEVASLAPPLDQQPSILNLTRTIPIELLPILAASRTTIIAGLPQATAPLAAKVTADPAWTGHAIKFQTP